MNKEQDTNPFTPDRKNGFSIGKLLLLATILAMASGICWAVWSLPTQSPGLSERVFAELKRSGVNNQVTAVVLNFRGYDTLLEICVLLLAVLGTWTLGTVKPRSVQPPSGPILPVAVGFLVPVMVLVGGYLLWAGKDAPGGAFQAGAVLGAAGVLLLLSDGRVLELLVGWQLRALLAIGISVFLSVAVGVMVVGERLLEYPVDWAGHLILLVESAATVSVAVTLAVLFVGGTLEETDAADAG